METTCVHCGHAVHYDADSVSMMLVCPSCSADVARPRRAHVVVPVPTPREADFVLPAPPKTPPEAPIPVNKYTAVRIMADGSRCIGFLALCISPLIIFFSAIGSDNYVQGVVISYGIVLAISGLWLLAFGGLLDIAIDIAQDLRKILRHLRDEDQHQSSDERVSRASQSHQESASQRLR